MNNVVAFCEVLEHVCPGMLIYTHPSDTYAYGYDNSRLHHAPHVVVFPRHPEDVSQVLKAASQFKIPVTPRGRGTNTTGASVPLQHGLVMCFEKMQSILRFEPENRLIHVQVGMTNEAVQQKAKTAGLFWPPDPSSFAVSSVGGNLACNAAGPHAVKYGSCRENVLGLTAVRMDGKIFRTGADTTKNSAGFDLTRLLIGSEGTLAVITDAVLKLSPMPSAKRTLFVTFANAMDATQTISQVMQQPLVPATLEFMDEMSLSIIEKQSGKSFQHAKAALLIEIEGMELHLDALEMQLLTLLKTFNTIEIVTSKDANTKEIWGWRKALSPGLRTLGSQKINEDVVVPVSAIPTLVEFIQQLSLHFSMIICVFGHGGNGNLHVNLCFDPDDEKNAIAQKCLKQIFEKVIELHGSVSGEHGIGFVKKEFFKAAVDETALELMKKIKEVFDPEGLLNPGKII